MALDELPTIPSTWTAPTSCFASTNYFFVLLGNRYFSNVYGTPTPVLDGNTPTGDCFPPNFSIDVPYLTDGGCPKGYTRACAVGGVVIDGQTASSVTCCPSVESNVFSWMCRDHEYGCHATSTGATWTGIQTDIGRDDPRETPVTRMPGSGEGIEAWGIKFIQVPATSTSSEPIVTSVAHVATTTNETDQETQAVPHSVGLSTGAAVGIAVGSLIILALVLVGAFAFFRMRKQKNTSVTAGEELQSLPLQKPSPPMNYHPTQPSQHQQAQQPMELPAQ